MAVHKLLVMVICHFNTVNTLDIVVSGYLRIWRMSIIRWSPGIICTVVQTEVRWVSPIPRWSLVKIEHNSPTKNAPLQRKVSVSLRFWWWWEIATATAGTLLFTTPCVSENMAVPSLHICIWTLTCISQWISKEHLHFVLVVNGNLVSTLYF